MALQIRQFPCLQDNYGFLIVCSETGACAAIDTPEPARILEEARCRLAPERDLEHASSLGPCRRQ